MEPPSDRAAGAPASKKQPEKDPAPVDNSLQNASFEQGIQINVDDGESEPLVGKQASHGGATQESYHLDPCSSKAPLICLSACVVVLILMFIGFVVRGLYAGVMYGGDIKLLGEVISSTADDREFAYIELDNGLRVLLVSDPDAYTAAAAMDVNVGSLYDPKEFPGLSHAIEHCLFLG
jgi:hypothetical protein